jgi:transcriptional regulator with XRE-family HTH domain
MPMRKSASITFRTRLRELRLACRWTQKRAAQACHMGHKQYQLYEIGVKTNPELLTLEKIAKGFGLEVHEFLAPAPGRVPKHPPAPRTNRKQRRQRRTKKRR